MLMAKTVAPSPWPTRVAKAPPNARAEQVTYRSRESLGFHLIQDDCGANGRSEGGVASGPVACGTVNRHGCLSRLGVASYGMLPSSKRISSACLCVSVLLKMWWR